jgi:hypothetical protein
VRFPVKQFYRSDQGDGEGIIELRGGLFEMDSYTTPGVRYKTHPQGYCTCPRYEKTGYCKKHPILAEAVQKARKLRFGTMAAERNVIELCTRIFASYKHADSRDSHDLLLDVRNCRYSTPEMERESIRRHMRILALSDVA